MSSARPLLPPWFASIEAGGWWQATITARSPALRAGASRFSSALEEVKLLVADERGVGAVLAGDDAGALEDVRVEADDRDEGGIEGEVDAGLIHRGADDGAGVR